MTELLHAGSLVATGVGACCVALDGPRPRVRELALSVVMVLAMLDVVLAVGAVPVIAWSALTLVLAMALAVRRRRSPEGALVSRMRVFSGVGAVLMATLMLVMAAGPAADSGHHHGLSSGAVTAGLLVASGAYALACGIVMLHGHEGAPASGALRRRATVLDRLQLASMSGSVLLLALGYAMG